MGALDLYSQDNQSDCYHEISDISYNRVLRFMFNDLYLNKNTKRDKDFYKWLHLRTTRYCKENNINHELFFKKCKTEIEEGVISFTTNTTKVDIEVILEARNITNNTNNALRKVAQKIVDKKYRIQDIDEAINVIRKIWKNIKENRIQVLGYQLWNFYVSMGWEKNY